MNLQTMGKNLSHLYKLLPAFSWPSLLAAILFSVLFSAALSAEVNKDEKWYEVEVLIFANNDKTLQESEKWPEKPGAPNIQSVMDLFSAGELLLDESIENLPMYYVEPSEPGEDNLSALANRIERSKDYTLLTHRTWHQTVTRKKSVLPVYLDDNLSPGLYQEKAAPEDLIEEDTASVSAEKLLLEALLAEEQKLDAVSNDTPFFIHDLDPIVPFEDIEGMPSSHEVELSPMGPPNHSLFGTFKLFQNRYLHVAIDFLYKTEPYVPKVQELPLEELFPMAKVNEDTIEAALIDEPAVLKSEEVVSFTQQEKPPIMGYRLQGSKRVRLKEVHYFDHPLFGVVLRVISYEPPEPEEDVSDTAEETIN